MKHLGIDIGTSSIKLVMMEEQRLVGSWEGVHCGNVVAALKKGLGAIGLTEEESIALGLTGADAAHIKEILSDASVIEEIPSIVEGARFLVPKAKSIMEIGSQGSRFIAHADGVPQFTTNGHCAGGTGSFFEDQMSRLGLSIEDFSSVCAQARSVPRLSGRCAVFAKTDIIHRQQEGVPTPDILLGLCYAMIKNYKAIIVGSLPVERPVVFCGGVTKNSGVVRAIREVFALAEEELFVPEDAIYASAIGAALHAAGAYTRTELITAGEKTLASHAIRKAGKEPLATSAIAPMQDPAVTGTPVSGACALGIDIGSTSTDLVIVDAKGNLLDYQYLRTAGNPKAAVQKGLDHIKEQYGELEFLAVGVTGSGRERIGKMIGADVIRDEITAQAAGAAHAVPQVDTVFEIGGQDSKFISLQDGEVADFQMNKICAAGTGSFVEEQAARMGIAIDDFGGIALSGEHPADLGERCTVFIETAIASAAAEGTSQADIAAGLCYSIVQNYLHKVVGTKHIGEHIVLQGGVAYNPAIVAAFRAFYGERITVNPYFSISGALGAALLALEANAGKASTFAGYEISGDEMRMDATSAAVRENVAFYKQAKNLLLEGYTGERKPGRKTVGVPYVLMIHKFFPMANAFFQSLGYNVLLSDPTDEETIRLSQENARGETCYPVKLIYGHMQQLIDAGVDHIFLPTIHTMKHEQSHVAHNYGCVYMQTAAVSIARELRIEEKGITLLSPVFDLDFGKKAMATSMIGLGKILGIPKPFCVKALLSGAAAVRRHTAAVEEQGKKLLASLSPEDKVLVLITRNYGVSDPVLNMGIPEILLERGYKVITLSHLPGHSLDISAEYPNLYWPFGQHILSGAKLIAHHPNLYAVYLTNHGCGPDTMLSHLFKKEMGDKPYLQIEVDEHFSKVGVITRIEAFLNSLSRRESVTLPSDFALENVAITPCSVRALPQKEIAIALPDYGIVTPFLASYLKEAGYTVELLAADQREAIACGRGYTNSKEYLPFAALLGAVALAQKKRAAEKREKDVQYLLFSTLGAEADGMYAQVICDTLATECSAEIVAPTLEQLPQQLSTFDAFTRAVCAADLWMLLPKEERSKADTACVPSWKELVALANRIAASVHKKKKLGVVGTPLSLDALSDGILEGLSDSYEIMRAPLIEYLYFLWLDNEADAQTMRTLAKHLQEIANALGEHSPFSEDFKSLMHDANQTLSNFSGGNGRYRYAKTLDLAKRTDAILTFAPRYENTEIILRMRGLDEASPVPIYHVALDADWDETAASKLRSFLYYV